METLKKKSVKKWIGIGLLSLLAVIVIAVIYVWNAVLPDLDGGGYRYVAVNAISSYFKKESNQEVDVFLEKTGGFIRGVCHPNEDYEQIKEANIEWVRFDLTSLPYDENGNLTQGYLNFKARAKGYADQGMKVMCVTQYPQVYIEAGLDPRDEANKAKIQEYARFIAQDLQGIVGAFQITNEMGIEHFTLPLTLDEAAYYIGIQLEAMQEVKGDIVVGFNLAGFTLYNFCEKMQPYLEYCDYVALDLYLGCFENMFKEIWIYDLILRYIWNYTGKPVMLNEFGYIGYGDIKTEEQKAEILRSYGFESEEAARADIMTLINNLPEDFKEHMLGLEYHSDEELANKLFDTELASHLYRELQGGYQLNKYRHTIEDQARFFTDTIARLKKLDFLCGAIVYCYSDSDACYICGQSDCPVETGWGLIDLNGNPKPAYYAVQKAFEEEE